MPEDLSDKLQDFELMLEGFAADMEEDQAKTRLFVLLVYIERRA